MNWHRIIYFTANSCSRRLAVSDALGSHPNNGILCLYMSLCTARLTDYTKHDIYLHGLYMIRVQRQIVCAQLTFN